MTILRTPLEDHLALRLREEAARRGLTLEALAARLLETALETPSKRRDVSDLAGTWTQSDLEEFNSAIADMNVVDENA
jgi:plasmid stability protein